MLASGRAVFKPCNLCNRPGLQLDIIRILRIRTHWHLKLTVHTIHYPYFFRLLQYFILCFRQFVSNSWSSMDVTQSLISLCVRTLQIGDCFKESHSDITGYTLILFIDKICKVCWILHDFNVINNWNKQWRWNKLWRYWIIPFPDVIIFRIGSNKS